MLPSTRSQSVEAMLKQFKNPFEAKFIKYRVGATSKDKKKGIALFYIDAREVMKRLDEVCGMDGWSKKEEPILFGDGGIICNLTIRMPDGENWVTKSGVGECTKVTPLKGASSDALKRAAVNFGIGRYLYYIPNQWYPFVIGKDGKPTAIFAESPQLPDWAKPQQNLENWEDIAILEYDPSKDVDLEYANLDFTDKEAETILKEAQAKRKEILASLKGKK